MTNDNTWYIMAMAITSTNLHKVIDNQLQISAQNVR